MSVSTYKGTVENGQIKLEINVNLPEKIAVYYSRRKTEVRFGENGVGNARRLHSA